VVLEDFDSGSIGAAEAVDLSNSPAGGASNSVISNLSDDGSPRLRISDPDGGTNGARLTFSGAIPGPGYYLVTADVKVDNSTGAIGSYGMAAVAGSGGTTKISDANAGYVMNLTGSGDAALGYQTIGAAINVPSGGVFPQDLVLYFGTDVSGNDFNAPAADGDFDGAHRGASTWPSGTSNAVYVDNVKRIGPGNFGEERHLWISVGDGYTDLAKLESQLVAAKTNNFNCVDILARYRSDAYYIPNRTDSTYANPEPLGTRVGGHPVSSSNDPLQYALDRGHELGLKIYVSFSSFLVSPDATYPSTLPSGSIMYTLPIGQTTPRPMTTADGQEGLWADPGRNDVRDYTKSVFMDMITNYDIDGVIFDRTRYPATRYGFNPQAISDLGFTGTPSPFNAAYTNARRDAITSFIGECYEAATNAKPWLVVGATPVAFSDSLADTYNSVLQFWPKWTSRPTLNRNISFGCIDLLEPQFYRLASSGAPAANATLISKTIFGDTAVFAKDFGAMPGSNMAISPLFFHPSSNDPSQSAVNSQNIVDARVLGSNGVGLFSSSTSLDDIEMVRAPENNSQGVDVLATPAPFNDYLMKAGYDNLPPNAAKNFVAAPRSDGSVLLTWSKPDISEDGDFAHSYLIYRGTAPGVKEYWTNLATTKLLDDQPSNNFVVPAGLAGSYYYRIVSVDHYNNHGPAVEIGPFAVSGSVPPPPDVIVDNPDATFTGAWSSGSFSADKFGNDYKFTSKKATSPNTATFTAVIPVTGSYDVYEWHSQGTNRATDAHHTISHDGGSNLVIINQQSDGGQWNKLGTYQFTGGQSYTVLIDSVFTGGSVAMADAIRWSYVPVTPPTPSDIVVDNVTATKVGAWSLGTGSADKFATSYNFRGHGTGGNQVIFTAPIVADGMYDVWEWHPQGANRAADARHMIGHDGGVDAVTANQQINGGKWNKLGTFPFRAGNNYNVIIDDVFTLTVTGQVVMADAIKWSYAGPLGDTVPEVILDNPDATVSGAWSASTSAADKFGGNYLFKGKSGQGTVMFTSVIPQNGVYDVFEWHPAGGNRAQDAPHYVTHMGGVDTVSVNQSVNGGKWNQIGTYQLHESLATVAIDNLFTLGDIVIADAIRWVYSGPLPASPLAPRDLYAKPLSQTEVSLTWNDRAANETSYEVLRNDEVVASLSPASISYTDSGLSADTEYRYVVRAMNGFVQSCPSNSETVRTKPVPPADPSGLEATVISESEISLAWSDNADNETHYEVLRNGSVIATLDADAMSFNDTGLSECTEYQYTVRAYNDGGSSAESNVVSVAIDLADPTITAPPDVTADNDAGKCSASGVQLGQPQTDDNCGVDSVTNDAPSEFPVGDTSVTWTVTDVHGNKATATQKVTVTDVEKPVVSAPADVVVPADPGLCSASAVVLGDATATDNCGVEGTPTSDAPETFSKGETVITWSVTDVHGNVGTATQKVTVEDREDPSITCPGDVQVACSVDRLVTVNFDTPSATDNCSEVDVVCDPPSGSQFPVGSTPVTVTATDSSGNKSTCTFNVVRAELGFDGFHSPVGGCVEQGTGGDFGAPVRAFKLGSTIPLKFGLSCNGSPISSGIHTLQAIKYDTAVSSQPAIDATPTDAATTGNQFRLTDTGEWHFNLKAGDGFSKGTWLLVVNLSDGSTKSVWISLK
jgi:uncharacterized lipoprotein YddW (UPF0748 family)